MARSNQSVEWKFDPEANELHMRVLGFQWHVLDLGKVSDACRKQAMIYGFANCRLADATAIPAADGDGNLIPETERAKLKDRGIARLIEHYNSGTGEWRLPRGTGESLVRSLTIEGLARAKGVEYEEAESMVDRFAAKHSLTRPKALAKLRGESASLRTAMEAIRVERAMKAPVKPDVSDALDMLA